MDQGKDTIDALADLMKEFGLAEAKLRSGEVKVVFRQTVLRSAEGDETAVHPIPAASPKEPETPKGTPITSPMNGIFYSAPSPSSPAFVKEGEPVTAGQVVGLIEAMKVFNEITAGVSGTVAKVMVESGTVVQPGDVLMLIA